VWSALCGPHRGLAGSVGELLWYPPSIAPFAAIRHALVVPDLDAARAAASLPERWRFVSHSRILQLFPTLDLGPAEEEAGTVLGEADRAAMQELTQIAFPDFFRARTAELGLYLGVFSGGKLVAMAGERLALDGLQEISGVCTHPEHAGQGHARRLTRALLSRQRRRGVRSFLHVSEGNSAARSLYDSMGFKVRASLGLCKVERLRST